MKTLTSSRSSRSSRTKSTQSDAASNTSNVTGVPRAPETSRPPGSTPAPVTAKLVGQREQQREDTRRMVLNSAIALFSQRGFDGTGLPAIAAESGVTVPLMLYHFKSKELLWREAVSEVYRRVETHIASFQPAIEQSQGRDFYRLCSRATSRRWPSTRNTCESCSRKELRNQNA